MKSLPEQLHERALELRRQHQTHDLAILEQALREGAQIMAEYGATFIKSQRHDLSRQRHQSNLPQ